MQIKIIVVPLQSRLTKDRASESNIFEEKAEIAQLVEHDLAKVGVASSSLVFRSKEAPEMAPLFAYMGEVVVFAGYLAQ